MIDTVTILAVDDQPANLRLLDAVLSPRGYRVVSASSGDQALELLPSAGADLVLLDIVMPGLDGYEVCRRLRQQAVRSERAAGPGGLVDSDQAIPRHHYQAGSRVGAVEC